MPVDFERLALRPAHRAFGHAAWYRQPGVQPMRISVIPFLGAKEMTGLDNDGAPISDIAPMVGVRLAELAGRGITPAQGDRLTLDLSHLGQGDVDFQISDIEPDGEGGAVLKLNQLVVPG